MGCDNHITDWCNQKLKELNMLLQHSKEEAFLRRVLKAKDFYTYRRNNKCWQTPSDK